MSFRPRLTVVLIFLTLMVAVVGYHITRDSGAGKAEEMTREALRIFAAGKKERMKPAVRDPSETEARIRDLIGAKVTLPRDERLFSYNGATREKIGKQAAAAVHLTFSEEPCLLIIRRPDPLRSTDAPSVLLSEASFLSWEKDGTSFVFWERDGVLYLLVSGVDLTHTFDLVRQYFT
ncbi:MAG: hypothetical protein HW377_268 [Actinobacteria bacterium]|nr:hypothetical protein [Actinomycetota bacterium]